MTAQTCIIISAAIILLLGLVHLAYTYFGNKLHPRDSVLLAQLKDSVPVITRQTTMWKGWIGFNASHSLGAILFGVMFAYLAWTQPALLLHSWVLGCTGLITLTAYLTMAKLYWFSQPFQGIALALLFYVAGFVVANMQIFA